VRLGDDNQERELDPRDLVGKASLMNPRPLRARAQRAIVRAKTARLHDVAAVLGECDDILARVQRMSNLWIIRGTLCWIAKEDFDPRGPHMKHATVKMVFTKATKTTCELVSVLFMPTLYNIVRSLRVNDFIACAGVSRTIRFDNNGPRKDARQHFMMCYAVELIRSPVYIPKHLQ
jgi:hypothetical protein